MISTVVLICTSSSWHSKLLQLTPHSYHLLSSCTNASLEPPSLPKSTTLTQQPSQFVNRLLPTLTPSNHRLINIANLLHPCMLVSQLPCMIPFARFGSLLQWYMSYSRTATRYRPAMVLSTATQTQHLCECYVKPADTVPDATTTTLQTPARPHVSMPQSASTKPAQPVQPILATPVTPKPQATAVPAMPAVPEVTPASTPATPSVTPVQPRRSGCAHVAPKHLIQEM